MVNHVPGIHRNPNVAVRISLREYVEKLGVIFGVTAKFDGPGPIGVQRSGHHSHRGDFAVSYLFNELFSKFDDGKASESKWETCLQRFYEAEELCRDTNWRFQERTFLYKGNLSPGYSASRAMWLARRKIEWLLGSYDDAVVLDGFGFGPGASTRLNRSSCDLAYKLGGIPQATPAAASFVRDILPYFPKWELQLKERGAYCQVVEGNKVVSVPKNYKTDRMIAIEPDWNMFLQKGIGSYMRKKLRKVGIDLDDQSNNAFCAGLGSLYDDLATIDLSMASDCVSVELVRFLLPPDWFDALEQCRSPVGVLTSGEIVEYQKFSSMGNGYTFELETLVFWALCSAVIDIMALKDRRLLVYGDDIVVPSESYQNVVDVLTLAGFVPNPKKSFGAGPFRESCGSHFYEGHDVTPIYIREPVTRLDRLFLLHNNSARLLERFEPFVVGTPEDVATFLAWIRSHAPESWRKPRLPRLDIGDGAFYGCFSSSTPKRLRHGWEGWSLKTLQPRAELLELGPESDSLLKGLWLQERQSGTGFEGNSFLLRLGNYCASVGSRNFRSFLADVKSHEIKDSPRHCEYAISQRIKWRVSKQRVMSLALGYCWWEVFASHPAA